MPTDSRQDLRLALIDQASWSMSVGGFLALIEDAAAAPGYETELSLFPEGELPAENGGEDFKLPLAEVKLRKSAAPVDSGYLDAISSATV